VLEKYLELLKLKPVVFITIYITAMRYIIFFTLFLSIAYLNRASAQPTWSRRFDLHLGNDYATQVLPVENGMVIQNSGFCDYNTRDCHGLFKLDLAGNMLWKEVIYDTLDINGLLATVIRGDSILLNMAYMLPGVLANTVLSFDMEGNYLSRHDYTSPHLFAGGDLLIRQDGNLYVKFDVRDPSNNRWVEHTRCFDPSWSQLWELSSAPNMSIHRSRSAVSLDTGMVLCYTAWPGGGQDKVFQVEKYSKDGELQWRTKYQHGCDNNQVIKINAMPDGSYIGAFASDSFGVFAADIAVWFKLDAQGNRLWEKVNIYEERAIYHSFVNRQGNIIACGDMRDNTFDTIQDPSATAIIMCLNPDGERLWERKVLEKSEGIYQQYVSGGAELPDGSLAFVGMLWDTTSPIVDPRGTDMWVFRTDSLGCFEPGCSEWQILVPAREPPAPARGGAFTIYPNPVKGVCQLAAVLGEQIPEGQYMLRAYSTDGRHLFTQPIDPHHLNRLDFTSAPAGTCSAVLLRDGLPYQVFKVLKL
jgi:hypothetical protein